MAVERVMNPGHLAHHHLLRTGHRNRYSNLQSHRPLGPSLQGNPDEVVCLPTLFLKRRWPSPWMAVRRMSRSPSWSKSASTAARPEHHYYCCHNRRAAKHKRSTQGRKRCRLPYIRRDQLDDFIFRYTAPVLRDPDLLPEHVFSEDHLGERLSELRADGLSPGEGPAISKE